MSLVTLQQGPLGVAASARTRDAKSSGSAVARVAAGAEARTNAHPQARHDPADDPARERPMFAPAHPGVAPTTLFETSQIAAAIPMPDVETLGPAEPRADPWQPPSSSLALRDRSV